MNAPHRFTRRRTLKTLFCSSAFLSLNIYSKTGLLAEVEPDAKDLDVLLLGDFGTSGKDQLKVAKAMREFCHQTKITPEALFLLGDNFYSADVNGFTTESVRWKNTFEDVYPAADFPGPCWAVLGNHDYHDNPGGQLVQLAYAKRPATRWKMPAKWYRFELGSKENPLATVIALDSDVPEVSGGMNKKTGQARSSLTKEEQGEQLAWLEEELKKDRAPFTIVMGHHPLYSNGEHGDTKILIDEWGPLFQKYRVHAYLCGHDHDLQHLELEGRHTSFVLSGGGGASTRSLKPGRKMPFGRDIHGFTHLKVTHNALVFSHYDSERNLLHQFTKRQDGSIEIA